MIGHYWENYAQRNTCILPSGGLFSFKLYEGDASPEPGRGGSLVCLLGASTAAVLTNKKK